MSEASLNWSYIFSFFKEEAPKIEVLSHRQEKTPCLCSRLLVCLFQFGYNSSWEINTKQGT